MKILCISDTHSHHKNVEKKFPEFFDRTDIDAIVHAGDISSVGREDEVKNFLEWFSGLHQFTYKIFIAGNHDFLFENAPKALINDLIPNNVDYLEDSGVEYDGVKFWGSPVTPPFFNWAFMREPKKIKRHWDAIPDDIDVLITHTPPNGVGDFVSNKWGTGNCGCNELVSAIHKVRPSYNIVGHIHEGYGKYELFDTQVLNVSSLNGYYKCSNEPIIIEI